MNFSLSGKLFIVGLLMYMPFSLLAISKDSRKNARQAVRTYTTIADRYALCRAVLSKRAGTVS